MNIQSLEYDYQIRRLALGVEFEDYLRDAELIFPLRVEIERDSPHVSPSPARKYDFKQLGTQLPDGLLRSNSGRYSLTYYPGIREQIDLRCYDYERNYIPRRFRVPLLTLQDVIDIEEDEIPDYTFARIRQVVMFPGAAYHCHPQVTGLRGRVERDGAPMRWVYVEVRMPGNLNIIARTRGDDRGEFLLLLPPQSFTASDLSNTLDLEISIVGPVTKPVPATENLPQQDQLWDLPLEELPPAGGIDDVASGESYPAGYVTALSSVRTVTFVIGRLLTGRDEDDFDFVMP